MGDPANAVVGHISNVEIAGQVVTIAPSATAGNNALVTYDVHLSLGETALPVLVGMTANANLITAEKVRQGVAGELV